ncbi:MAG: glycosyltransferase family 2 protein [Gammaproteobacteria bacterium]
MGTQYPSFEVIVVNDGSKDCTLQVLIDQYQLEKTDRFYENHLIHKEIRGIYTSSIYPNLVVVDKENGGRSDALNTGIDVSRNPLFCTLDADSLLDPSALLKTVQPFIDKPDEVVATGGTVRILNGCDVENAVIKQVRLTRKLLPLFQVIEYIRAFLMGRLAWSRIGILTIISGAFAVFRRDIAVHVGGFSSTTIGEDFELVMNIHKYCRKNKRNYEMRFVPEPVCWTEVPETMKVLSSQRIRWQQGSLEVFFKHREMFLNPKYGRIGLIAYPLIFIFDILGPLAELAGYVLLPLFYLLGALNAEFMIAFLCLFFVFGVFISTMSLVLEEISLKRFSHAKGLLILGFAAIIENFGYRQYNNIWRIIGWWRFILKKQVWGNMTRVGMQAK